MVVSDPYKIVRPTFPNRGGRTVLTTQAWSPSTFVHTHRAFVYADGSGSTDVTAGHFHRIQGSKVLEAAGHTHEARLNLQTGAGW